MDYTKAKPLENLYCNRKDCFTCLSSASSKEPKFKSCKKRSVVYQTWCQTCLDLEKLKDSGEQATKMELVSDLCENEALNHRDRDKICESSENGESCEHPEKIALPEVCESINSPREGAEQTLQVINSDVSNVHSNLSEGTEFNKVTRSEVEPISESKNEKKNSVNPKKRILEKVNTGPLFMYIGETARSAYERGCEHLKDLQFKRGKSHYLRHAVEVHPTVPPEKLKFRMKIMSCHKSAFERQIREAVLIDMYSGPNLMNSKLEYSRCSLPKMYINLGNKKSEDPMISKEKSTLEKIKLLYKSENKRSEIEASVVVPSKRAKFEAQNSDETEDRNGSPNSDDVITENTELVSPSFYRSNLSRKNEKLYNGAQNTTSKENELNLKLKDTIKRNKVPRDKIRLKVSPEKRSPIPKLGAKKKSPVPILVAKNESPDLKLGTKKLSPGMEDKIQSGSKFADGLQPKMVDSPSLRPVNVKNLINNFEKNVYNDLEGTKRDKMNDAFATLMKSKGDTQIKTPTRKKPKRLKPVKSTGKAGNVMDRWLRKF